MADLKALEEAMKKTLLGMGEEIQKKEQAIVTIQQQINAEKEEFNRLYKSFGSLTEQKNTTPSLNQNINLPTPLPTVNQNPVSN